MPFTNEAMVLRYIKKIAGGGKGYRLTGGRFEGQPEDGVALAVIGDVHGYHALFQDLIAQIEGLFDRMEAKRRVIVQVGDLIDRGPHSKECLDLAGQLQKREDIHYVQLLGNHEIMLRLCLRSPEDCYESAADWLMFGGRETIDSLAGGEVCPTIAEIRSNPEGFHKLLSDVTGPKRAAFVTAMQPAFLSGSILVTHAGLADQANLQDNLALGWDAYRPDHWAWNRAPSENGIIHLDREVFQVHGHSIHRRAGPVKGRFAVDSGVYKNMVLSAAVFLEGRYQVLTARSEL